MRPSTSQMSLAWTESPVAVPPLANAFPERAAAYPRLRYMGSKNTLLPWIFETIQSVPFNSALDLFSGTAAVAYLFKTIGKRVVTNDFLKFTHDLATATIENREVTLTDDDIVRLTQRRRRRTFIERTFAGIFFTVDDLRFLDLVWSNLIELPDRYARAVALASLTRACLKRQPRGVFTVSGTNYDDGRRDLRLPLSEHFRESVQLFNSLVFDNGRANAAFRGDALDVSRTDVDLVYMDPPYVPRTDDNCYIKRYHFLEGLASYWEEPGTEIIAKSRVKKIAKRFTPFSYRRTAVDAFREMFRRFAETTIVLSYSSNAYPDLQTLVSLLRQVKRQVHVVKHEHRYHFGTHKSVSAQRKIVDEYLIIGGE